MYKFAAMTATLTGVLSAIAVLLGLFFADVLSLAVFAALSFMLAAQLYGEKRMAAWLGFFFMLISVTRALMGVNSGSYAPNWVFYAIAALSTISALCLFIILWKSKTTTDNQNPESIR